MVEEHVLDIFAESITELSREGGIVPVQIRCEVLKGCSVLGGSGRLLAKDADFNGSRELLV